MIPYIVFRFVSILLSRVLTFNEEVFLNWFVWIAALERHAAFSGDPDRSSIFRGQNTVFHFSDLGGDLCDTVYPVAPGGVVSATLFLYLHDRQ